MKWIDDAARKSWRLWSLRLQALGLALQSAFLTWADLPVTLWNMMPAEVKAWLPEHVIAFVPLALFIAAAIARLIKQEKLSDGTPA